MMNIIESKLFSTHRHKLMSYAEYIHLREVLLCEPDLGDTLRGFKGLRAFFWKLELKNQDGIERKWIKIIYSWEVDDEDIRLLYLYLADSQEAIKGSRRSKQERFTNRSVQTSGSRTKSEVVMKKAQSWILILALN